MRILMTGWVLDRKEQVSGFRLPASGKAGQGLREGHPPHPPSVGFRISEQRVICSCTAALVVYGVEP